MNPERLLLAALLAAAACEAPAPASERVAIATLGWALDVPAGTEVAITDDGATFTTRPGARDPRILTVHARAATGSTGLHRMLAADVAIAYTLQTADGGSGGAESVLRGDLRVGARSFAVVCSDQAEWPAHADATWCLAWLATIRRDG